MPDKSPRASAKKPGRTIKEKRAERRAKADPASQMERLTNRKRP